MNLVFYGCLAVVGYLLLQVFLLVSFKVPTNSMVPEMMPGDFILVEKLSMGPRLFDSIKNDYPIGSILLWKPLEQKDWQGKCIGSYTLPDSHGQQIYVLDGYQRLSSLFGCLTNPEKSGLSYDVKQRSETIDLYYDLDDESFVYMGGREPRPWQVPVYILMSTMDFRRYSRKKLEPHVKEEKLEIYLDRADSFSRSLVEYKMAVIEVTNAGLDDAVDIFSRINTKGTEISPDWMVNTLAYNDDFSFAIEIDNLKMRLNRYHFEGISRTALFRCYQSAFDDKMYIDQSNIEKLARRNDFVEVVKKTTPHVERAVRFLYNELNVIDNKLLPYNTQLIFLMTFFKKLSNPTKEQIAALKEWFWTTSYSNYFTIYSLSSQRKAFAQFVDYLDGKSDSMIFMDEVRQKFSTLAMPDRISLASVRCKSLLLFELRYYREVTGAAPHTGGLNLKKIVLQEDNTPANIVPLSGLEKKLKWGYNELPQQVLEDEMLRKSFFLPEHYSLVMNESDVKVFLKNRLSIISQREKAFVERLGMTYTG